jgi:hypothetical protein
MSPVTWNGRSHRGAMIRSETWAAIERVRLRLEPLEVLEEVELLDGRLPEIDIVLEAAVPALERRRARGERQLRPALVAGEVGQLPGVVGRRDGLGRLGSARHTVLTRNLGVGR